MRHMCVFIMYIPSIALMTTAIIMLTNPNTETTCSITQIHNTQCLVNNTRCDVTISYTAKGTRYTRIKECQHCRINTSSNRTLYYNNFSPESYDFQRVGSLGIGIALIMISTTWGVFLCVCILWRWCHHCEENDLPNRYPPLAVVQVHPVVQDNKAIVVRIVSCTFEPKMLAISSHAEQVYVVENPSDV
jgi:hypothetical protein